VKAIPVRLAEEGLMCVHRAGVSRGSAPGGCGVFADFVVLINPPMNMPPVCEAHLAYEVSSALEEG